MSASPAAKPQWSEHKNSEGRTYWSHSVTKQSVWEKPDELRTPFERALGKTQWKQYTSKDRPYYVNSVTKETKWDLPPELVELKQKVERDEAYKVEKARRKAAGEPTPSPPRSRSGSPVGHDAVARYGDRRGSPTPSDESSDEEVITWPMGGFLTHEKAEEAFMYLLKKEGIDENWTWDQTMRKIVLDPLYKALNTLAEKKEAFEKYTHRIVAKRQAAKEARIERLRPVLHKLFAASSRIKSYSTTKTANEVFARDKHWREAKPDERILILEEFTTALRQREEESARDLRNRNIQHLGSLIRSLDINVSTTWRAAHNMILDSDEFRRSRDLQEMETIDILGVYDDYARQLEQDHEEEWRRLRIEHVRSGRKAREGFKALLQELQTKGQLTRTSKWKNTFRLVKNDERYLALLGPQGSSPLDLWMDAVDDISEEVERAAEKVEKVLEDTNREVKVDTSWEEFEKWVKDGNVAHVEDKMRRDVYDLMLERVSAAAADEARRAERRRRHRIDDLRYALKKVQRHIDIDMTFEEAKPHMEELQEYKDIEDEADRRTAFDKFILRQKEKLRESEDKSDRRDRMEVDEPSRSSRRDRSREDRHDSRDRRKSDKDRRYDYDDRDRRRERRREDEDRPDRKHRSDGADDRESKRARRSSEVRRDEVEEGEI
ncbi:hypothetical protein BD324DRAFT_617994 [Kockovaella imperatae]|uniref:WW domain-containing protein n=1 Tax=Kockovaella imperatae TaxID=4999 RepID=A0A1Y1ULN9_9TREE|nr:hypothetical protein BD324DRAFT_617994 [Kockovaella imperatae]ORX38961.1 hypothetical protein BD324DRAFT_617994 [Kockovaella imperatae]